MRHASEDLGQLYGLLERAVRAFEQLGPAPMDAWDVLSTSITRDARAEWWRRTQWALEAQAAEDPVRNELGFKVLENLIGNTLTTVEDSVLLDAVWQESGTSMGRRPVNNLLSSYQAMINRHESVVTHAGSTPPVDIEQHKLDNNVQGAGDDGND